MSIERWEMLLSTRADSYLLKIRGPREDVEKIVQSHPDVCGEVQEITDDTFQWAVFVVDAPLKERLAIQNLVMSMTRDPSAGPEASRELGDMLDGLSGALEGLTNLTEDEQAFVMKKVAQMQEGAMNAGGPLIPPAIKPGGAPAAKPVVPPLKPVERPPTAKPEAAPPPRPAPPPPPSPSPIVRPAQPPAAAPKPPTPFPPMGAPPPPVPPVRTPPPAPSFPPPAATPPPFAPPPPTRETPPPVRAFTPPPSTRTPPPPSPAREAAPPPPPVREAVPPPPPPAAPPAKENPNASGRFQIDLGYHAPATPPAAHAAPPPAPAPEPTFESGGFQIEITTDYGEPLTPAAPPTAKPPESPRAPGLEPLAGGTAPNFAEAPKPVVTPFGPAAIVPGNAGPAKTAPVAPTAEDASLASAIFYPEGAENSRDKFVSVLTENAQKKAKKPITFRWVNTQAVEIALDHAVEWIWTAKANGAECFFVILPSTVSPEEMEGVAIEAQHAGMKCFLVPMTEIGSKLLYMNLMVEMMLVKKKGR